jgi:hypothetical protein
MPFSQLGEHLRRASRETLRQRQQQIALRAESLHQQAGGDAGFAGDVGQRQLAGPRRDIARCAAI